VFATNQFVPELIRRETKVPLQYDQYQEFLSALINLGVHPRKTYADRVVRSVYLDTIEFDNYLDNVSGVSRRHKIRMRWYDERADPILLEIKTKRNKVSGKQVIELANPSNNIPINHNEMRALFRNHHPNLPLPEGILASHRLVLEVEYLRSYFELKKNIRMTIDKNIRYRSLFPRRGLRMKRSPVDRVIEFKYPVGIENDFRNLLRHFPFRTFRHSKYVVGMDTVVVS